MKRLLLLFAIAVLALPAAAQEREEEIPQIQVMGRAEREVMPDEFYLSIIINEKDSKGKISVEKQQNDMIDALKRLNIDTEKQLKLSNLASEFFKKKNSVAVAKYQLKLTSTQQLTAVQQALDKLGISNVSIQKVSVSNIKALTDELRIEAVKNARQTATALAEAVGQKLGMCFYIWDSNNDLTPRLYNNAAFVRSNFMAKGAVCDAAMEEECVEDEVVEFKTIKLEYSVQTKFLLR